MSASAGSRQGFTLVELLVVISIIGLLIALLLPAVQAARESGRQTQCRNNLKQIVLAARQHDVVYSFWPSGGVNDWNIGDPSTGPGKKQHAGWAYIVLPYMEQQALYNASPATRLDTPLFWLHCPSRRRAELYPNRLNRSFSGAQPENLVRSDYAACIGDVSNVEGGAPPKGHRGVCYPGSEVSSAEVRDGLSNTYFAGEKSMARMQYSDGTSWGDDDCGYNGGNIDTLRTVNNESGGWADYRLTPDPPNSDLYGMFGGPHSGVFMMSLCDGSVRPINYMIDRETHRRLGVINDGQSVDASSF